jgi:hypothetical protein
MQIFKTKKPWVFIILLIYNIIININKIIILRYLNKPCEDESKTRPTSANSIYKYQMTFREYINQTKLNSIKLTRELIYEWIHDSFDKNMKYIYQTIIKDSHTDNKIIIEFTLFSYIILMSGLRPGFLNRSDQINQQECCEGLHCLPHERFRLDKMNRTLTVKYFGKNDRFISKTLRIHEDIILNNFELLLKDKKEDEVLFIRTIGKSYTPKDYICSIFPAVTMVNLRRYHASLMAYNVIICLENDSLLDKKIIRVFENKVTKSPMILIRMVFKDIIDELDHDTDDKIFYYIDPRLVFRLILIFFSIENSVIIFDKLYENTNKTMKKHKEKAGLKANKNKENQSSNLEIEEDDEEFSSHSFLSEIEIIKSLSYFSIEELKTSLPLNLNRILSYFN